MPLHGQTGIVKAAIHDLDENFVTVDVKVTAGIMATVLKLDTAMVEKAMVEKGCKSSEVVLANTLAHKTGQPLESILSEPAGRDWLADCKRSGLQDDETARQLEDAYTEAAFLLMDVPAKKKNKRLAKK